MHSSVFFLRPINRKTETVNNVHFRIRPSVLQVWVRFSDFETLAGASVKTDTSCFRATGGLAETSACTIVNVSVGADCWLRHRSCSPSAGPGHQDGTLDRLSDLCRLELFKIAAK